MKQPNTAVKLDTVLRKLFESGLKHDAKASTPIIPINQTPTSIETVLQEVFRRDAELSTLLVEALSLNEINQIVKNIYDAKGTLYDNEDQAISNIKRITTSADWYKVKTVFLRKHKQNLQKYLSTFLETEDANTVAAHIKSILPSKLWYREIEALDTSVYPAPSINDANLVAGKIYNSKGVFNDDEDITIKVITAIKSAKVWFAVKKAFAVRYDTNLQEYLNSFLEIKQLNTVVSHLLKILPKTYWKAETEDLNSPLRPYDPKTGKEKINIYSTPEEALRGKSVKDLADKLDVPLMLGKRIAFSTAEAQKRNMAVAGRKWQPEIDTAPWSDPNREKVLQRLGAQMIYGGSAGGGKQQRQYTLNVYSNPQVEKDTSLDVVCFHEAYMGFSRFPESTLLWMPYGKNTVKLYLDDKQVKLKDPEGKIVKRGNTARYIDNLISVEGQTYHVDDNGRITRPGQKKKWSGLAPSIDSAYATNANREKGLDTLQTILDWVGLVPVIGDFVDAINASIYFSRGRTFEGFLSLIAVLPFAGSVVSGTAKAAYKKILDIITQFRLNRILKITDPVKRQAEFAKVFRAAIEEGGINGRRARRLLELVAGLEKYQRAFRQWRVTFKRALAPYTWIPGFQIIYKQSNNALDIAEREFDNFCESLSKSRDEVIEAVNRKKGKDAANRQLAQQAATDGAEATIKLAGWSRIKAFLKAVVANAKSWFPRSFAQAQANAIAKWFRNLVITSDLWKTILKTIPIAKANELVLSLIQNNYVMGLKESERIGLFKQLGLMERRVARGGMPAGDYPTKLMDNLQAGKLTITQLLDLVSDALNIKAFSDNFIMWKGQIADVAMALGDKCIVWKEFVETWWVSFLSFIKRDVALSTPYYKSIEVPSAKHLPELSQLRTMWAVEFGNLAKMAKRADVVYNEIQDGLEKWGYDVDVPNGTITSILWWVFDMIPLIDVNHWISAAVKGMQRAKKGQNAAIETGKTLAGTNRLNPGEVPSQLREPVKKTKP